MSSKRAKKEAAGRLANSWDGAGGERARDGRGGWTGQPAAGVRLRLRLLLLLLVLLLLPLRLLLLLRPEVNLDESVPV